MFIAKYFVDSVKIFSLTYELFRYMFFIPKHKGLVVIFWVLISFFKKKSLFKKEILHFLEYS